MGSLKILLVRIVRWTIEILATTVLYLMNLGKKRDIPPVSNPFLLKSATNLATEIRTGKVRSVDVVRSYIKRIREVQPIINAMVDNRFEEALWEARKADKIIYSGQKSEKEIAQETPLLGVPISIKETIGVREMSWTGGLVRNKGRKCYDDAHAVNLLRKAGAIILVNTNTSELGLWFETRNKLHGVTSNPYDTRKTAGGSSGGEAALITSAGSVIGLGNDLAGSIRLPAYFNGIYGHKPTRGVVSNSGSYPEVGEGLNQFFATGPLTRYAKDLRLMMNVLVDNEVKQLKLHNTIHLKNIKVYYSEDDGGHAAQTPVNDEIKNAIKKAVRHLESVCHCQAQKVAIRRLRHSFQIWSRVTCASEGRTLAGCLAHNSGEKEIDPNRELKKWFLGRSEYTLASLFGAYFEKKLGIKDPSKVQKYFNIWAEMAQEFKDLLCDNGVFLYPTFPTTAPFHNTLLFTPFNTAYIAIFNVLGLPVTQCPMGVSSSGLPIGFQIVGNFYCDNLTITVAEELEKAYGGWVSPVSVDLQERNLNKSC